MKKAGFLLLAVITGILAVLCGYFFEDVKNEVEDILPIERTGTGHVSVITAGGVGQSLHDDTVKAAQTFSPLMEEAIGEPLHRDVKLYVAATVPDYESVLQDKFSLSESDAAEIAAISGGWSSGNKRMTVINGGASATTGRTERMQTTAHELFHQMQYELSRGRDTDENSIYWLSEGSADYVGAYVASKNGGRSLEKWINDTIDAMTVVEGSVSPRQLMQATYDERKSLMDESYYTYQTADLMTIFLVSRYPEPERLRHLADYFRAVGDGKTADEAFTQAFGLTPEHFLDEYEAWWNETRTEYALFDVRAEQGISQALPETVRVKANVGHDELIRKNGAGLHGSYVIILTPDNESLMRAVAKGEGIPVKEAQKRAKNSLWIQSGSVIYLDASQLGDSYQQDYIFTAMMEKIYAAQRHKAR